MAVCSRRTACDKASASDASEFHACVCMRSVISTPPESDACWSNSSSHACTRTTEALTKLKVAPQENTQRSLVLFGPTLTWPRRAVVLSNRHCIVSPALAGVMLSLQLCVAAVTYVQRCAISKHAPWWVHANTISGVGSQHTSKQPVLKF